MGGHDVGPRSDSDQYNDESDEPLIASSKSKKHADRSGDKMRSGCVSSSSSEDQSSVARHRSSGPSGARPGHGPDPPCCGGWHCLTFPPGMLKGMDTFGRVLSLPDPGECA